MFGDYRTVLIMDGPTNVVFGTVINMFRHRDSDDYVVTFLESDVHKLVRGSDHLRCSHEGHSPDVHNDYISFLIDFVSEFPNTCRLIIINEKGSSIFGEYKVDYLKVVSKIVEVE